MLEPHSHTARKIQGLRVEAGAGAGFKVSSGGEGNVIFNRTSNGEVQLKQGTVEGKCVRKSCAMSFAVKTWARKLIEGVNAVGTRDYHYDSCRADW